MHRRVVLSRLALVIVWGSLAAAMPMARAGDSGPAVVAVRAILRGPAAVDSFRSPAAVLVRGDVFLVADRLRHRLVLFDDGGRCRGPIALAPGTEGLPCEPKAIEADARGRMFVVDAVDRDIRVLNSRGSRLGTLRSPFAGDERLMPQSIAIAPDGSLWVLYVGDRNELVVFDAGGEPRAEQPTGVGSLLTSPSAIAISPDGATIAVADPGGDDQLLLFEPDGRLRRTFGAHGEADDDVSFAAHLAFGPGNTLWVTDAMRHSIGVFGSDGRYLGRIGGFGTGPGQLLYPAGCEFIDGDRLLVVERGGQRCQVLEVTLGSEEQRSLTRVDRGTKRVVPKSIG